MISVLTTLSPIESSSKVSTTWYWVPLLDFVPDSLVLTTSCSTGCVVVCWTRSAGPPLPPLIHPPRPNVVLEVVLLVWVVDSVEVVPDQFVSQEFHISEANPVSGSTPYFSSASDITWE